MEHSPKGPYKHYQRPSKPRTAGEKPSSSGHWGTVIIVLIIILCLLIPTVHFLAASHNGEKVQEVQRVKKTSKNSSKKSSVSSSAKKSSASQKSSSVKAKKAVKTYVVKSGDSLTSIAQKHHLTVSKLASLNHLKDDAQVNIGQTLKLN